MCRSNPHMPDARFDLKHNQARSRGGIGKIRQRQASIAQKGTPFIGSPTEPACYLGSFGSVCCVKPTTIPKACSLPKTTESLPSGSGRSCFDFRKSFAFARSLVLKTSE